MHRLIFGSLLSLTLLITIPLAWVGCGSPTFTQNSSEPTGNQGGETTAGVSEPITQEPNEEPKGALDASNATEKEDSPESSLAPEPSGSEAGTENSPSEPPATPDGSVPEAPAPPESSGPEPKPSPTCQGLSVMQAGEQKWTLKHDGVTRRFNVDIPPQYDPTKPMPLVLNFHGLSSNAWQQKLLSKMTDLAKKEGFLVVYPEGRGVPQSWNAQKCCTPASSVLKSKDVDFVKKMLDNLESKLCIDKRRIFSTGMSNGAFMTYRLACELSDRIAAFAPVAGTLLTDPCKPKRPIPLLVFNGTSDTLVPYSGSKVLGFPSVEDSMVFWAKHNGCDPKPGRTFDKDDTYCNTYNNCTNNVQLTLCTTKNGGHTWPGGFPIPIVLGKTTKAIIATDEMWTFFKKHPLP